jgi:hypothetical protein
VVLAARLVAVDEDAEVRRNALDRRLAEHPAGVFDGVAAHVQKDAAARTVDVPEPRHVRPEMLFALLDQEDIAQGALVDQFLRPNVLGREAQLLGVQKQDPRPATGVDHLVGFFKRPAQGLLAQDVLAGPGRVQGDTRMQVVGQGEMDQVDFLDRQEVVVVFKGALDAAFAGEVLGLARGRRSDGRHLGVRHHLQCRRVQVGHETAADQTYADFAHGCNFPTAPKRNQRVRSLNRDGN